MEVRHRSRRPAKLEGREPPKKKEEKPQVEQSPRVKAIMDIVRKEVVRTMNCRYFALHKTIQVNVAALRKIAIETGLENDTIRQLVWPLLLGVEEESVPPLTSEELNPFLRISLMRYVGLLYHHREWDQVQRDIDRSLNNFTQGKRTRYRYEIFTLLSVNQLIIFPKEMQKERSFHLLSMQLCVDIRNYIIIKVITMWEPYFYLSLGRSKDSSSSSV